LQPLKSKGRSLESKRFDEFIYFCNINSVRGSIAFKLNFVTWQFQALAMATEVSTRNTWMTFSPSGTVSFNERSEVVPQNLPSRRRGHAHVQTGNKIIIHGGESRTRYYADCFSFDLGTDVYCAFIKAAFVDTTNFVYSSFVMNIIKLIRPYLWAHILLFLAFPRDWRVEQN